jgi:hypothetical protein
MASIEVTTAALHTAAAKIDAVADNFAAAPAPAVPVSTAQATTTAVNAVHAAAHAAESTMSTRLRSTAAALADGGRSFAATERASTDAIRGVAPGGR